MMRKKKTGVKTELFGLKVTPEFKSKIERAARDAERTASDYVRRLLRARLIKGGYLNRPTAPKSKRRR